MFSLVVSQYGHEGGPEAAPVEGKRKKKENDLNELKKEVSLVRIWTRVHERN